MIRIVLVDDHRIVREGLASMLHTQSDLEIVGEAGTGREAIALIERLRPDLVLLDVQLPDLDGVRVLEQLRAKQVNTRVLILTAYSSDERLFDAIRAGARGYLLKDAGLDEVLRAIHTVAAGGSLLESSAADSLLTSMERLLRGEQNAQTLTERERTILLRIAQGQPNKAIAQELSLAERTIKFHITIIFQKLAVTNRTEAVAKALQDRLIHL